MNPLAYKTTNMRALFLFSFCLVMMHAASAQINIESILKQPETKEMYYFMSVSGSKVMYLPMEYGKADFTINQAIAIGELKTAVIAGIDLVYSDYPAKADFSALNRKRLETLRKILPEAFNQAKIQFRKVRQTAAKNKEQASYLTHGFYIYYRPTPDKKTAEKEIGKLSKIIKEKTIDEKKSETMDGTTKICSTYSFYEDTAEYVHELKDGFSRTITKISRAEGIKTKLIDYTIYKDLHTDSVYYVLDVNKDSCEFWDGVYNYNSIDTTVSEVFSRHKWTKALILADVTGSMYPYSGQLLLWLKLIMTDNARRQFVFFNDGDEKPDAEKIIGNTGGIYQVVTSSYDEVEKKLEEAMRNGSGGDAPENNIEALLSADKLCSSCDSVVMIADNWAPVKDISLLAAVKKPIKIVLCGVYGSVNTDYLKIAYQTKGSVHLIEQDIYELSKMKEGDIIEIKGKKYKISGGEFKEVIKTGI